MRSSIRWMVLAALVTPLEVRPCGFVVWQDATVRKEKDRPCCDPALEPGTHGVPLCIEGPRCRSDGRWRCNDFGGVPACSKGKVCR